VTTRWRAPLTGSRFYTGSTQRIPQRSQLRRRLVPRSSVECRRESNDLKRFDLRGELLLRVVRVGRVRDLRPGSRRSVCLRCSVRESFWDRSSASRAFLRRRIKLFDRRATPTASIRRAYRASFRCRRSVRDRSRDDLAISGFYAVPAPACRSPVVASVPVINVHVQDDGTKRLQPCEPDVKGPAAPRSE
jgi:hypothetical protein